MRLLLRVLYCSFLTLLAERIYAGTPLKKLLFIPFFNEAVDENLKWLEESIGDSVHEAAKQKFVYVRIPERDFRNYFIQTGYERRDLFDLRKISKMANDLAADGVIFGAFRPDESGTRLMLTGKILSVNDSEIIAEKTVTMPVSGDMFTAVEEVSVTLGTNIQHLFYPSDRGAAMRAAMLPGWGHRYKQSPVWAYIWGGLFWTAAGFTVFSAVQFIRYSVLYKNYAPETYNSPGGGVGFRDPVAAQAQFDVYTNNIATWRTVSLIGVVSMGVIYAANILHAYSITPEIPGMRVEVQPHVSENRILLSQSLFF